LELTVTEPKGAARSTGLVKDVCDYLKDNSTSKITLRDLGKEFGVSPFHLQRAFSGVMGVSPRRYLEECRLNDLRSRLATGEPVVNALRGTVTPLRAGFTKAPGTGSE
jgi:AraC family transcriptional regulator, regulatory protein of adaptative response / methylated-DNA-[protein]-cysteine methyltransferase